ncbi:MAG: hypothetical protein QOF66_1368 [Mycobacterium sp.]|jgi:acyl dehydratase|uniref:MaoC/PaaZ C-terminal domain-containing protein n=1 Tax=Mycobacterium sp. TaxID=1785 RepID=UPI0028B405C0|nr:hypothetical protein [Mycobacterium sp.]
MAMHPNAVGTRSSELSVSWTPRDCMLYALAVGAGADDPTKELAFTTENSLGITQSVLPTFLIVPGIASFREVVERSGDFDPAKKVHGAQSIELHRPVPVSAKALAVTTIDGIFDKGSGALVATSTLLTDVADGSRLATLRSTAFIKGEGGWGGDRGPSTSSPTPLTDPDRIVIQATTPNQALLYRLTGDRNPLHSDPVFARRGGSNRPILQGLCTYGFAVRALLKICCDGDPTRFVAMSARFSSPVRPGDLLTTHIWRDGANEARFRVVTGRGTTCLDGGEFRCC